MEKTSAKKAAQYIRMSTDLQRYSTANQIEVIAEYATDNNLEIIETYVDEGKSGLRLSDARHFKNYSPMSFLGKLSTK